MNATITYTTGAEAVGRDAGTDVFHDPVVLGIGIAFVIATLVILAMGGLYYWGVLYGTPSWSNHSFPAPIVY
jgi:hypothetical protein